jgi:hypothetical protein
VRLPGGRIHAASIVQPLMDGSPWWLFRQVFVAVASGSFSMNVWDADCVVLVGLTEGIVRSMCVIVGC